MVMESAIAVLVTRVTALTAMLAMLVVVPVTTAMADHPVGPETGPAPVVQLEELAPVQVPVVVTPVEGPVLEAVLVVDLVDLDPAHLVAVLVLVVMVVPMVLGMVMVVVDEVTKAITVALHGNDTADTIEQN